MYLSASAEVYRSAYASLDSVRKRVVPYLNRAFAASELSELRVEIRYVPIVMPESMRNRYPDRSKLHLNKCLYDCAPQLAYEVFVSGSEDMQVLEYIKGISLAASQLARLGASESQINIFLDILASAPNEV